MTRPLEDRDRVARVGSCLRGRLPPSVFVERIVSPCMQEIDVSTKRKRTRGGNEVGLTSRLGYEGLDRLQDVLTLIAPRILGQFLALGILDRRPQLVVLRLRLEPRRAI